MIVVDDGKSVFSEIVAKCLELEVIEKRKVDDGYCELVFRASDMDAWETIFTEFLGAAAKPSGAKPSRDDLALTGPYGGIAANQTLFKKECGNDVLMAMFWPWDEDYVTLKAAIVKN